MKKMTHNPENCIFCKIIEGTIPCAKVYEDEQVLAFLDISQSTKGHTLVIPKVHKQDVFALTPDIAAHLFSVVPGIAKAIQMEYGATGFNLLNNSGEQAGQTVFHFHLHLLPRYSKNDGFKSTLVSFQNEYTANVLQEMAGAIARRIE